MELQIETKNLLNEAKDMADHHHLYGKDYIMTACLIGIMERLERLQGAILSLQGER